MVLHYNEDDLGPAEVKIIHDLVDKGCNYVSFDDMVPRMPGHYQFWQQALNDLLCHTIEQKAGHILGSLIEMAALPKVHELLDKANKALTTLKNFKHVLQQKVIAQVDLLLLTHEQLAACKLHCKSNPFLDRLCVR